MKDIKEYLLKKIGKEESFKLSKMTVKGIILEVQDNGILLEITECNNDDIGYKVGKTYFMITATQMYHPCHLMYHQKTPNVPLGSVNNLVSLEINTSFLGRIRYR